jgi:hypothetical protein
MPVGAQHEGGVVVAEPLGDRYHRLPGYETGNQRCSNRCECLLLGWGRAGDSSWLVIAGLGELGGVAVPVAAGVADPADGGGGVQVE